ncbi:unnamed protein product [Dovyalis caffra]|uniref:Uncharacterized protein n=1 Tax=Dovyalis caffra TaxID=77055 RepID=A0AAV1RGF4_9ROSI|nr:unnamed protein product [Dovyalis caffra]
MQERREAVIKEVRALRQPLVLSRRCFGAASGLRDKKRDANGTPNYDSLKVNNLKSNLLKDNENENA